MKLNSKIKNPFIVALLTGRGGSKLKNKNIEKFNKEFIGKIENNLW